MTARSHFIIRQQIKVELSPSNPVSVIRPFYTMNVDPSLLNTASFMTGGSMTISLVSALALTDPAPSPQHQQAIPVEATIGGFHRAWWIPIGDATQRTSVFLGSAGTRDNGVIRIPMSDVGLGRIASAEITFALNRDLVLSEPPGSALFALPRRLVLLIDVIFGDTSHLFGSGAE